MRKQLVSLLAAASFVTSHPDPARAQSPAASEFATDVAESLGCPDGRSRFWNAFYRLGRARAEPPETHTFGALLESALTKTHGTAPTEIRAEIETVFNLLLAIRAENERPMPLADWIGVLAALELGDRSSAFRADLQARLQESFLKLERSGADAGLVCHATVRALEEPRAAVEESPLSARLRRTNSPAAFGAKRAFATAYQSCDVLGFEPVPRQAPDVQGIRIVGRHPLGPGQLRRISSLAAVVDTHYYLQSYAVPGRGCFDVTRDPLIYDYGGKPAVTSGGALDFFTDHGTGTEVLGTDCSGFVFTALASAGLRLSREVPLKPDHVTGVSARMLAQPESNAFTCLARARIEGADAVRPGDIIANSGHVVMVDQAGADPFGIAGIQSVSDCAPTRISYKRFDFTILQSSPSKNGLGLNRMRARDYFGSNSRMRRGLEAYALAACHARFGQSSTPRLDEVSVVRHDSGSPSCRASAVPLEREDCLSHCLAGGGTP